MKKGLWFSLTFLLAVFVLTGCVSKNGEDATEANASGEASYNFKIAHVVQTNHIWHATAEKFGEILSEKSDGRMDITVYPAAQLGAEADMVQQLETGSLDIGFMTTAYMSTRETSLNAWFMPYIFPTISDAVAMNDSQEVQQMFDTLATQGLVGLEFVFAGNRHVLMLEDEVKSPADLSGKKIRIIGSPAIQSYWETVGAAPTSMPLSEIYTSLQSGLIDGIDIDLDALVTEKYYEVANNLTLTNQMTFPSTVVFSKKVFDKLSAEDQQIVREAMKEASDWAAEEVVKREEANLTALEEAGVNIFELQDTSAFAEAATKVQQEFSEQSDIIKSFIETASK